MTGAQQLAQPPVHTSEIKNYLKCKLYWFWTAPPPRGLGLEPKMIRPALNTGRVVHKALQDGYDTQEPFVDTYRAAVQEYLEKYEEADSDTLDELETCGSMIEGYEGWAAINDPGTKFLATETQWGPIEYEGIPLSGRFDAVVKMDDGLWIMDFKTTKYLDNPWTTTDLQATIYTWAARQLYSKDVRGLIFRFLRKKAPMKYHELILKDGTLTTRKNLSGSTTYEEYITAQAVATLKFLAEKDFMFAGEIGLEDADAVPISYYRALLDGTQQEQPWYPEFAEAFQNTRRLYHRQSMELKGPSKFFWDVREYRTEEQIENYFRYIVVPCAHRMTAPKKWVGPTGLGSFRTCTSCSFRAPCKLRMDNADFRTILNEEFQLRDIYEEDYEEADRGQDL